jgi:hypothetical protein
MVFLFYNKLLLRIIVALCGIGIGLTGWYYVSLSYQKLQAPGLRDAAAIVSFLIAGWLVMLIAEVVDNHYLRAFGCLCAGLGGYISYPWIFRIDAPKLIELPGGAAGMHTASLGFWTAEGLAAALFAILVTRLVLDRLSYGRRAPAVARADVSLGPRPAGMGSAPPPDALPPIPVDTSPLPVAGSAPLVTQAIARQPAPIARLVGIGGMYLGSRFELGPGEHVIGRQEAEILLANDNQVSRKHAVISIGADGLATLTDSSTNGSFVNDQRVQTLQLAPGDVIRIGTTLFKVEA